MNHHWPGDRSGLFFTRRSPTAGAWRVQETIYALPRTFAGAVQKACQVFSGGRTREKRTNRRAARGTSTLDRQVFGDASKRCGMSDMDVSEGRAGEPTERSSG